MNMIYFLVNEIKDFFLRFFYRFVEMEDKKKDVFIKKIVDKIIERERESWIFGLFYQCSSLVVGVQGMFIVLDVRFEFGLEIQFEFRLKVCQKFFREI